MSIADEIIVKLTAQTAELKAGMAEGAAVVKTTQDEMAASMAAAAQKATAAVAEQKTAMQAQIEALVGGMPTINWRDEVLDIGGLKDGTSAIKNTYAGMFDQIEEQEKNALAATIAWSQNLKQTMSEAADSARFKKIAEDAVAEANARQAAYAGIAASARTSGAAEADAAAVTQAASQASVLANEKTAASMQTSMNAFRQFDAIQKGSITTAEELASAQAAVQAAQESGAFTAEEIAEKQALVAAAMKKVGTETQEASGFLSMFTRNSRTMYSTSALITDAMTGQFSRMRREVAALGNETGLMSAAMRAAVGPAGLVAAGLAAIAALAYTGAQRVEEFQQALEKSNDASGLSASDLRVLAESAGHITNSFTMADEAVKDLAADGHYSAQQIQALSLAIVQYAQGTGESVKEVMRVVSEIANDPKKALEELRDKMGALSPQQAEIIENMIRMGQKQQAIDAEFGAFETRGQEAFDHVNQQAGGFLNTLNLIVNRMGVGMRLAQDGVSNHFGEMASSANPMLGIWEAMASSAKDLNDETDKTAQKLANAKAQTQSGPAKGSFGAFQQQGEQGVDLSGNLESQLKTLEVAQKVSYDERKSFESEYWAYVLSKVQEGSAQYIEAYRNLESVDHELSDTSQRAIEEVQRKREEAAHKAEAGAKRAAEAAQRAEDQEAAHVQEEMRKETQAREEAARKAMELARQVADTEISTADFIYQMKMVTIKGAEKLGITSAQQALQQEIAADDQLYQSKLAAYTKELIAARGNAVAMAAIQKQITQAQQQEELKRAQYTIQMQEIVAQRYKQMMQPMLSAFQQSINGMIQGTQTFKQAMANMGQSIVAEFVNQELQMLSEHIATEMAKKEVTIASNEAQVAANEAGQAQSLAIQGAAAVKWIITEAAKAAAGAFNALVSIPYVGPFLAVGASIAAFAAVSKLVSSVASAEGGWERVPADGMMTELHKDEMVLPAHVANPMRDMARNGGSGRSVHHYHISANDAASFAQMLKRNPRALADAARHAARRGYR